MYLLKSEPRNHYYDNLVDDYEKTKNMQNVGYWRKANMIHKWFVDNVQGGVDECQVTQVSKEQLLSLIHLCEEVSALVVGLKCSYIAEGTVIERVIKNIWDFKHEYMIRDRIELTIPPEILKQLQEKLPTQEGFFFGSVEYDDYYFYSVIEAVGMLEHALREMVEGNEIYYYSSW